MWAQVCWEISEILLVQVFQTTTRSHWSFIFEMKSPSLWTGSFSGFWNWPLHHHKLPRSPIWASHFFWAYLLFWSEVSWQQEQHKGLKHLICFTASTCYASSEECRTGGSRLCVESGRYKSTSRLRHVSRGKQTWEYVMKSPEHCSDSRGRCPNLYCDRGAAGRGRTICR